MLKKFINFISNIFSGSERSITAKKNILYLLFIKGYSVIINLTLISVTLNILNDYKYGIWITIFNVLSWIQIFDIGIGNGLRNKFTECNTKGDKDEVRAYVSTSYIIIIIISLSLIALFLIPWYYVNWASVFSAKLNLNDELSYLILIVFILTCVQFSIKLIGTILTADHKPFISSIILALSNTIILASFLFFQGYFEDSIIRVGVLYASVPVVILLFFTIVLFSTKYKEIKPSIKYFDGEKVKELFSLGGNFFIIQIAFLVIFQTDTLIISHVLSPTEVTPYNIVFRYFGVITMLTTIIMTPLWSAYTEAYVKKDFVWIRLVLNKKIKGFVLISILVGILLLVSKPSITLWLGKNIHLNNILLIGMALYTIISVWNNMFSFILNGLSKTKIQLYTALLGLLVNIPLSIYLANIFGAAGVIMATCISLIFFAIFGALETFKILKKEL